MCVFVLIVFCCQTLLYTNLHAGEYPDAALIPYSLTLTFEQAFSNMWQAIASAKKRVWMETFILEPDAVGLRTIQELARAAARGVEYEKRCNSLDWRPSGGKTYAELPM
jgi:phosphatidylserine/phosphatidylglycerophosphate/cardiolipin synthase-like enzyme